MMLFNTADSICWLSGAALLYLVLSTLLRAAYNLWLHPARHFPGPWPWAAFHVFKDLTCARGNIDARLCQLHAQYGPVVRISPDELSFVDQRAWRDIYARPNYLEKWPRFAFVNNKNDTPADIINSSHVDHARIRRQLSYAFSDKALREQEGLIRQYIDLLLAKLSDAAASGAPINMVKWYNLTTFDIVSDLAFGQSFSSLNKGEYHPWVAAVFKNIRAFNVVRSFATYPGAKLIIGLLSSSDLHEARKIHKEYSRTTVQNRLARGVLEERRDFISYTLKHKDEAGIGQAMSTGEIIRTASTLIMAGSETTATVLSGLTYFLAMNPDALSKVTHEVRSTFKSESEITFENASSRLPYLLACFDETLRMYPPVPFLSPRLTPPGVTHIAGHEVPGGMGVGVARLATTRNPTAFFESGRFHPERWLPSARKPGSPFYHDARDCFQSFLLGPGACLGRNLAYHEMRTIMSRILWRFDIEICAPSQHWLKGQRSYVIWDKPPLMCRLLPRVLY